MSGALDAVTFGEAMAMFMACEPGPLHAVSTFERGLAGAETNVAVGLARLGHRSGWIGRVGADPFGTYALETLRAEGVDTRAASVDGTAPTGFQLKGLALGGDPEVRYFRAGSAGSRLASTEDTDEAIASARHLHLTGIPLALSASTRAFALRALEIARAHGATVSFDPNIRPTLWTSEGELIDTTNAIAARADWVLPGRSEGRLLTGRDSADGIADFYLGLGASRVAVKDGAAGASLHAAGHRWDHAGFRVSVVDTVGAGDGFAAGLISAYLDGLDDASALERASAVGALATTHRGDRDGLPTREQLSAFTAGATLAPAH
ncbi:2-dehydro-3-deoxygluconokinase [Sinomonas atrocyanea]|uniref:2-dehydro-3-deoxygluconokinase n=1 Tax=Sinomonas atrocyanea TaxID=37927 RepID=A0A126ZYI6_9MICC|nr:sugar kinase [Sinomonas atrocyanea]AMM32007.1 2-dehydro-3-deoxygluconokinase [Sinomonas atrocyanea]GEB65952.1 sugar kinase [Sinomonas atrocyanea]GGG76904.1 sugar kinase [Sinomonas atrocyanea]